MARFRTLDPAMKTSPQLDGLSLLARLALVYLTSEADDDGRLLGDEVSARIACFPRGLPAGVTGPKLAAAVAELVARGLLVAYEVEGQRFLAVTGWRDGKSWGYQFIDRPKPSRFPAPPAGTCPIRPRGPGRPVDARGQAEIVDTSSSNRRGIDAGPGPGSGPGPGPGRDGDGDRDRDTMGSVPEPSPAGAGSGPSPSDNGTANGRGAAGNGALAARLVVAALGLHKADPRAAGISRLMEVPERARDAAWMAEAETLIAAAHDRAPQAHNAVPGARDVSERKERESAGRRRRARGTTSKQNPSARGQADGEPTAAQGEIQSHEAAVAAESEVS